MVIVIPTIGLHYTTVEYGGVRYNLYIPHGEDGCVMVPVVYKFEAISIIDTSYVPFGPIFVVIRIGVWDGTFVGHNLFLDMISYFINP